ncbi:MAG: MMPL family transporter [Chloroflexota bacterium]|nr:MMPL family transporter [Chloroflexota bacterium]
MVLRLLHSMTAVSSSRRGKFVVIGVWLLLVLVLTVFAPKLAKLYNNTSSQSLPAAADSQIAQDLLLQKFPATKGTPAILVFSDPGGLSIQDRFLLHQVSDWLGSPARPHAVSSLVSVFTVPQAAGQLLSHDGTTTVMIAQLQGDPSSSAVQQDVKTIRAYLQHTVAGSTLQGVVTGPAGVLTDLVAIFGSVDLKLLFTTVSLVFVLLILLYRSPILAFLPLIAVGLALQVANALLAFGAQAGVFSVSQMSANIATVLLFGAGTDYGLFIASRFREELQRTQEKHEAMRETMRAVGEAITSSAGTVLVALFTLLLASLGLYTALAPTLIIAILIMLLAGLTLVPALIVWLGRAAYWPLIPRVHPDQVSTGGTLAPRGFWGWLGAWVSRHRVLAVLSSTLLLGILALGNIGSQPSLNFLTSFRVSTDSTQGYALLQQHFSPGTLAPTTILLRLHGTQSDAYQHLVQLDAVTADLQQAGGVASVQGPTRPVGNAPTENVALVQAAIAGLPASLRAAIRSNQVLPACQGASCPPASPQEAATIGAYAASTQYISSDNTTVSLTVDLADDPYSLQAITQQHTLRNVLNRSLTAHGLGPQDATSADAFIAGQTAQLADTLSYNQRDTLIIVPVVLALVFLVLVLLLRSLIAPLYLLAAVALNFLAAIGVCGFFFQRILGQDGFNYAIPLYTFIFLVALGADYTIFLMARIREESQHHDLASGVPLAVSRTGGVITSAGLILAGTFLVLTSLPLTLLYQLGVCVAVGILLDTFLVRGLLVPGLVLLLGQWNWWPGHVVTSSPALQPGTLAETMPIASGIEQSKGTHSSQRKDR